MGIAVPLASFTERALVGTSLRTPGLSLDE
jgi:hypothetical protein